MVSNSCGSVLSDLNVGVVRPRFGSRVESDFASALEGESNADENIKTPRNDSDEAARPDENPQHVDFKEEARDSKRIDIPNLLQQKFHSSDSKKEKPDPQEAIMTGEKREPETHEKLLAPHTEENLDSEEEKPVSKTDEKPESRDENAETKTNEETKARVTASKNILKGPVSGGHCPSATPGTVSKTVDSSTKVSSEPKQERWDSFSSKRWDSLGDDSSTESEPDPLESLMTNLKGDLLSKGPSSSKRPPSKEPVSKCPRTICPRCHGCLESDCRSNVALNADGSGSKAETTSDQAACLWDVALVNCDLLNAAKAVLIDEDGCIVYLTERGIGAKKVDAKKSDGKTENTNGKKSSGKEFAKRTTEIVYDDQYAALLLKAAGMTNKDDLYPCAQLILGHSKMIALCDPGLHAEDVADIERAGAKHFEEVVEMIKFIGKFNAELQGLNSSPNSAFYEILGVAEIYYYRAFELCAMRYAGAGADDVHTLSKAIGLLQVARQMLLVYNTTGKDTMEKGSSDGPAADLKSIFTKSKWVSEKSASISRRSSYIANRFFGNNNGKKTAKTTAFLGEFRLEYDRVSRNLFELYLVAQLIPEAVELLQDLLAKDPRTEKFPEDTLALNHCKEPWFYTVALYSALSWKYAGITKQIKNKFKYKNVVTGKVIDVIGEYELRIRKLEERVERREIPRKVVEHEEVGVIRSGMLRARAEAEKACGKKLSIDPEADAKANADAKSTTTSTAAPKSSLPFARDLGGSSKTTANSTSKTSISTSKSGTDSKSKTSIPFSKADVATKTIAGAKTHSSNFSFAKAIAGSGSKTDSKTESKGGETSKSGSRTVMSKFDGSSKSDSLSKSTRDSKRSGTEEIPKYIRSFDSVWACGDNPEKVMRTQLRAVHGTVAEKAMKLWFTALKRCRPLDVAPLKSCDAEKDKHLTDCPTALLPLNFCDEKKYNSIVSDADIVGVAAEAILIDQVGCFVFQKETPDGTTRYHAAFYNLIKKAAKLADAALKKKGDWKTISEAKKMAEAYFCAHLVLGHAKMIMGDNVKNYKTTFGEQEYCKSGSFNFAKAMNLIEISNENEFSTKEFYMKEFSIEFSMEKKKVYFRPFVLGSAMYAREGNLREAIKSLFTARKLLLRYNTESLLSERPATSAKDACFVEHYRHEYDEVCWLTSRFMDEAGMEASKDILRCESARDSKDMLKGIQSSRDILNDMLTRDPVTRKFPESLPTLKLCNKHSAYIVPLYQSLIFGYADRLQNEMVFAGYHYVPPCSRENASSIEELETRIEKLEERFDSGEIPEETIDWGALAEHRAIMTFIREQAWRPNPSWASKTTSASKTTASTKSASNSTKNGAPKTSRSAASKNAKSTKSDSSKTSSSSFSFAKALSGFGQSGAVSGSHSKPADTNPTKEVFLPNDVVVIHSLDGDAGKKFNGQKGIVIGNHKQIPGKLIVKIPNLEDKQVGMWPEKLKLESNTDKKFKDADDENEAAVKFVQDDRFFVGDHVIIEGLVDESELNGRHGIIRKALSALNDRYHVEVLEVFREPNSGGQASSKASSKASSNIAAPKKAVVTQPSIKAKQKSKKKKNKKCATQSKFDHVRSKTDPINKNGEALEHYLSTLILGREGDFTKFCETVKNHEKLDNGTLPLAIADVEPEIVRILPKNVKLAPLPNVDTCRICMDSVCNPVTLKCHHAFCKDCVDELEQSLTEGVAGNQSGVICPFCRSPEDDSVIDPLINSRMVRMIARRRHGRYSERTLQVNAGSLDQASTVFIRMLLQRELAVQHEVMMEEVSDEDYDQVQKDYGNCKIDYSKRSGKTTTQAGMISETYEETSLAGHLTETTGENGEKLRMGDPFTKEAVNGTLLDAMQTEHTWQGYDKIDIRHQDEGTESVIRRACDTEKNMAHSYADGDQSKLTSSPGVELEQYYTSDNHSDDYNPFQRPENFSRIHRAAVFGDVEELETLLDSLLPKLTKAEEKIIWGDKMVRGGKKSNARATAAGSNRKHTSDNYDTKLKIDPNWPADLQEKIKTRQMHLERRESSLRKSPLQGAICGSRFLRSPLGLKIWPECLRTHKIDHLGCVRLLIRARADTNAKDILGNSCVLLAASNCCSSLSLKIAHFLVDEGNANPHATNRVGSGICLPSVFENQKEVLIEHLKMGVDPGEGIPEVGVIDPDAIVCKMSGLDIEDIELRSKSSKSSSILTEDVLGILREWKECKEVALEARKKLEESHLAWQLEVSKSESSKNLKAASIEAARLEWKKRYAKNLDYMYEKESKILDEDVRKRISKVQ